MEERATLDSYTVGEGLFAGMGSAPDSHLPLDY